MRTKERLLSAIVDIQIHIKHDIDQHTCAACLRWDELQAAAMEACDEITRLRAEVEALAAGACIHAETLDAESDHDAMICGYDKLRAKNQVLRALLCEAMHELEGVYDEMYPAREEYPNEMRRYERDMDLVNMIRDALRGEGEK